jgi:DNA-binding transcriptional LysR family regulator
LDLSSVDIFLAVAEENSVTRAAKRVGRVPSNVTIRIQQLELDLGVVLFSREGKKMTLTREGRTFHSYAIRLTALALEARHAVKPSGPSGSLRVGTMESTAASRLPEALTRFNALWPAVSLRLTMGATRDLTRAVMADELDCALIARPPKRLLQERSDPDLDDLESEPVFDEELLLVLPASHPAIRSPQDLRVDALAALEPGCTYRRIAEYWGRTSGSLRTLEVNSYHAILASVSTGNSVGVMPKSVLDLMHWPAEVRTHSLGRVDTLLVCRRESHSRAFDAFREVLFESREATVGASTG